LTVPRVVPFGVADARVGDEEERHRRLLGLAAISLLIVVLGHAVTVGRSLEPGLATAEPLITLQPRPTSTTATTRPKPKTEVPDKTWLATPLGAIGVWNAPGGKQVGTTGYYYGYQVTLPILESTKQWVRVRLPERPNGSTGWVQRAQVSITSTAYRIVIHRDRTNVTIYKDGFPLFTIPAGLGKSSTPTPLGSFFVAVIEQGTGGYGSYVLDTSGHSEAIQSWEGSGDAVIAMHGPISSKSDAQIGSTGTYISNGCIRLHRADQDRLGMIPVGTPVDIVP
jgi:lipoprotein-anchoring transpeptidase ErfK/SrfK